MLKAFLKWSTRMARLLKSGVRRCKNEIPSIELISVKEDQVAANIRRHDIQQLLARLHVVSHKRGRPKLIEDDESYAA